MQVLRVAIHPAKPDNLEDVLVPISSFYSTKEPTWRGLYMCSFQSQSKAAVPEDIPFSGVELFLPTCFISRPLSRPPGLLRGFGRRFSSTSCLLRVEAARSRLDSWITGMEPGQCVILASRTFTSLRCTTSLLITRPIGLLKGASHSSLVPRLPRCLCCRISKRWLWWHSCHLAHGNGSFSGIEQVNLQIHRTMRRVPTRHVIRFLAE